MASVAADPSAIAPSLPPPSRTDAASPAGPSSAFADLLDTAAPATAPQPQGGFSSRADDGANAAQSGATGIGGNASSPPTAANPAAAGTATGRNAAANDTHDPAMTLDPGAATLDVTLVAGLLLPPVSTAVSPDAEQIPAAAQDSRGPAEHATSAIGSSDTSGKPDDRKDASASSDRVAAGLVPAVPILIPTAVAGAIAASVSDSTTRGASSPVTALRSDAVFSAPDASAAVAAADVASSGGSAQQSDQTTGPTPNPPAAAQDGLPAAASVASAFPPTDQLQTADWPAVLDHAAAEGGTSDQNGRLAPTASAAATPAASSGALTPVSAFAPLTAAQPTSLSAELHAADQPAGNTGAPREAEGVTFPLPAQAAVRFAPSVHAADDNMPDHGTDVLWGSGGHDVGGSATITNSGPAGGAMPASFNSALVQVASAPPVAPSHATLVAEAVPLAGIPIAIVARAEAGEKKFEIRLDPPDLGRIEVQLNVNSSGRATSHLIVDRADTLDLLRRDAPALERALQSAGLTTGDGALQFSLRDQSFAGREQAPTPVAPAIAASAPDSDLAPIDTALRRYGASMGLGGGIDIRV